MATQKWIAEHQEQMRAYRRTHYRRNRQTYIVRTLLRKAELKEWYHELKKSLKCARCPETHWACLEFHHTDSKSKDISVSTAFSRGWSKTRILLEIAKCIVLCANCHRKEHHPE